MGRGGESDSQDRCTPLMLAASNGHADCVRLLIDAKASKKEKSLVRVGRCFIVAQFCLLQSYSSTSISLSLYTLQLYKSFVLAFLFLISLSLLFSVICTLSAYA